MFGSEDARRLVRAGRLVSVACIAACPPLLIADLGRPERFPNGLPNTMFEFGVRSGRDGRAGFVGQGNLRDRVAPGAILGIAKAGMIRIELHDGVAIDLVGVAICRDHAHVDMVKK